MSSLKSPESRESKGWFTLPPAGNATAPPERRGSTRDGVRLLEAVGGPGGPALRHMHFRDIPRLLAPGDLLVVNTSATLPSAFDARRAGGDSVVTHVSTQLDDGDWIIEMRRTDGTGPVLDGRPGEVLVAPGSTRLRLVTAYPDPNASASRLWRAKPTGDSLTAFLAHHGRPIRYQYLDRLFPLSDHQTVFATHRGSAEMPSAGRPFTAPVVVELVAKGVTIAPVVLHAGVSSPEMSEPPTPERFVVSADTARLANSARQAGRRVVAVGTTVVRALETTANSEGTVEAGHGWTDLVLGPDRPARSVSGLVTGLHAPEASHLLLLEAVAGADLVRAAYQEAVDHGYLWHEFGDSMLFLP